MWNHYPNMRKKMVQHGISFPLFTSNEMAELIAYIYFVGYFDNPPPDADRLNGKALFRAKGCMDCHSLGGEGGDDGPDLTGWKKFVSPVLWARIMWNHAIQSSSKNRRRGAPPPRFVSDEMGDLIAYIYDTGSSAEGETIYSLLGSPARGSQLFVEKSCIKCHSVSGKGGNTGPPLSIGRRHRSAMQFAGMMWNHSQAVSEGIKREGSDKLILTGAEMADLTAYLFLIGYFDELGDMAAGEQIFKDKGCIMCHKIGGTGGDRGPELTRYRQQGESLQPVLIAQAMWNHAPLMAAAMEEKGLPWPRFNGKEMADLLAFIGGIGGAE
jgi:cytochrome c2